MRLEAAHYTDRDGNPRSHRVVSAFRRPEDADFDHRVGGSRCACGSEPLHRQDRDGSALSGGSGRIHPIPKQSLLSRTRFHTRPGDFGALCGFANDVQKIADDDSLKRAARKIVTNLQAF